MSDIALTVVALDNRHWICQGKVLCLVVIHEFTMENLPPQGHILPSVEWTDLDLRMEQERNTNKRQASKSPKGVKSLSSHDFCCVQKSLLQQQLSDISEGLISPLPPHLPHKDQWLSQLLTSEYWQFLKRRPGWENCPPRGAGSWKGCLFCSSTLGSLGMKSITFSALQKPLKTTKSKKSTHVYHAVCSSITPSPQAERSALGSTQMVPARGGHHRWPQPVTRSHRLLPTSADHGEYSWNPQQEPQPAPSDGCMPCLSKWGTKTHRHLPHFADSHTSGTHFCSSAEESKEQSSGSELSPGIYSSEEPFTSTSKQTLGTDPRQKRSLPVSKNEQAQLKTKVRKPKALRYTKDSREVLIRTFPFG